MKIAQFTTIQAKRAGQFFYKERMMNTTQTTRIMINACLISLLLFVANNSFAQDLLGQALVGDVSDTFNGQGVFWKVFILIDVILATAMAVKTKNPMVFIGVAAVAFIPGFLIKTLVF